MRVCVLEVDTTEDVCEASEVAAIIFLGCSKDVNLDDDRNAEQSNLGYTRTACCYSISDVLNVPAGMKEIHGSTAWTLSFPIKLDDILRGLEHGRAISWKTGRQATLPRKTLQEERGLVMDMRNISPCWCNRHL
jgi:hypothetical protein